MKGWEGGIDVVGGGWDKATFTGGVRGWISLAFGVATKYASSWLKKREGGERTSLQKGKETIALILP